MRGDGAVSAISELGLGSPPADAEPADQPSLFSGVNAGPPVGPAENFPPPAAEGGGARRPGRPKGSKNRSTREWQAYLLRRHGSPLEGLLELAARLRDLEDVKGLARELGIDRIDALKACVGAAVAAAPYLHQRLPIAVDGGGIAPIPLVLNMAMAGGQTTRVSMELAPRESLPFQDVTEADLEELDGGKSDGDASY